MQKLADYYKLDKSITIGFHNYIPVYEELLEPIRATVECLVEIGIGCVEKGDMLHVVSKGYKTGNSLRMWRDYLQHAEIHGIDIHEEATIINEERIITHIADQSNEDQIKKVFLSIQKKIDIVIDDGSHNPNHQICTFQYIHPFLKTGAIYCIEDIFSEHIESFKNLSIFPDDFRKIIQNEYTFKFFDKRTHSNDNSVVCVFIKKDKIVKEIYVNGIGGLGNIMFQIATAAYYSEIYGFNIKLNINSNSLHFGTANHTNRDRRRKINDLYISYKDTIFKNNLLEYIQFDDIRSVTYVSNNYSSMIINPKSLTKLEITGYCQNYKLFLPILDKLPNYFNLEDNSIYTYIHEKYQIDKTKHHIMIGLRVCDDFSGMNKITKTSYIKALQTILKDDYNKYCILIIADRYDNLEAKIEIPTGIEIKYIDEDDVVQFYAGQLCNSFILSESTYHYWIALLKYCKNRDTEVYYFMDTDLTNHPLCLPEWHRIPL
jgi:hypothetical protein